MGLLLLILIILLLVGGLPAWPYSRQWGYGPSGLLGFVLIVLLLALSGSWEKLAVVSALARLVTYTGACAATLQLRRPALAARVKPATFVAPLGPVVPVVAILVSLAVVAGATRQQLLGGTAALAAGAVFFLFTARRSLPPARAF